MVRLSVGALLLTASTALATKAQCPKGVHVFATPGAVAKPGQLKDLEPTVQDILTHIPNSTYLRVPWKHNANNNELTEIDPGQMVLEKSIEEFVGECPDTPLVMLGYSEGACMTMDALCGASSALFAPTEPIDSKYLKNLIAVVVYGDETRAALQSYNRGTCQGVGILTRLNPVGCDPYASLIRSFCDTPDPYCCVGGNNATVHSYYAEEYDKNMIHFVLNQYAAFKAGTLTS